MWPPSRWRGKTSHLFVLVFSRSSSRSFPQGGIRYRSSTMVSSVCAEPPPLPPPSGCVCMCVSVCVCIWECVYAHVSVCAWKGLWCSSTVWLLSTQNVKASIYIRLSLSYHVCECEFVFEDVFGGEENMNLSSSTLWLHNCQCIGTGMASQLVNFHVHVLSHCSYVACHPLCEGRSWGHFYAD